MASMVRDGGGGSAIADTPDLAGLAADNMDSDDLVPTIQQVRLAYDGSP